jgi:hypothetical protein
MDNGWDGLRRGGVLALTAVAVAVAVLIPAGRATAATAGAAPPGLAAIPVPNLTWYKEAARHDPARRARRRVGLCRSPF